MKKNNPLDILSKAKDATKAVASNIADIAVNTTNVTVNAINDTTDKIKTNIKEKKQSRLKQRAEDKSLALEKIENPIILEFINSLDISKVELSKINVSKLKKIFPIPNEQSILWADAEFDLRPNGIVVTDYGIFIKTDVSVFANKKANNKSQLLYFKWDSFNARWFISDSADENKALLVDKKCSQHFIEACKAISHYYIEDDEETYQYFSSNDNIDTLISEVAPVAVAGVKSAESAVFVENKSSIKTPAGHGEMAEEAITMLDKISGLDAKVIGRNNAKDSADRIIEDDTFIQTKYYNSARGSLESSFNSETGLYRYMNDGQPMQLEVPSDQYDKVLEMFKKKIADGKVQGVTDLSEAAKIVKKGRLTYKQAVNLTKAGTIKSLTYDALTGAVMCSCVFGITFISTTFMTFRETNDIKEAIGAGTMAGIKVFGISFAQHIVVSQIARTSLANTLIAPSTFVVQNLGTGASTTIVNGIRALSGKSALHGVAATKHLAKIIRSNVLTSAISFAVFSVPHTYNLVLKKISASQYAKNITVLAGGVVAGAGGSIAAGVATAKIAGVAGTAVAPGVGTAIGIAGGFIGGAVGAKTASTVGDILVEDDIEKTSRLFNAIVTCMVSEYLFNSDEIDKLVKELSSVPQKELKLLFTELRKSNAQEELIRGFLSKYFEKIALERDSLPSFSDEDIATALTELDCED